MNDTSLHFKGFAISHFSQLSGFLSSQCMLFRYLLTYSSRHITPSRYPTPVLARNLFLMAAQTAENGESAAIPLPDITGMTVDMHTPLKTPKRRAATQAKSQITSTADNSGDEGAKASGSDLTPLHSEAEEEEKKPKKTPKPRKPRARKPSPVYEIPEVVRKETTFKGRLGMSRPPDSSRVLAHLWHTGYACLNTILRKSKPDPIFCSRTLRIATIKEKGVEYMKELGKQNMRVRCYFLVCWCSAERCCRICVSSFSGTRISMFLLFAPDLMLIHS